MTSKQREQIFFQGTGLEENTEDSIAIGCLIPSYCPSGIDAVMHRHTQEIDMLLQLLLEGSKEKIELLSLRGFTFSEYQDLFNLSIPESSFREIAVFQYFHLVKEKERRKLIYSISKEKYEDYLALLFETFKSFSNFSLFHFFLLEGSNRTHICKKSRQPRLIGWPYRFGKEQGYGTDVLRVAKKITEQQKVCDDSP